MRNKKGCPISEPAHIKDRRGALCGQALNHMEGRKSMDEVKISSPFLTDIISKLIKGKLQKKLGYKIDINLNDVKADFSDGKIHAHLDVDCGIEEDVLKRILEKSTPFFP